MDHDDILTSDALFMIVSKLNEGYDIVYTDEDKTDENLNRYFSVYRKPDFNLNLFFPIITCAILQLSVKR